MFTLWQKYTFILTLLYINTHKVAIKRTLLTLLIIYLINITSIHNLFIDYLFSVSLFFIYFQRMISASKSYKREL